MNTQKNINGEELASLVRGYRSHKNLTQQELADRMGVSLMTITRIESRRQTTLSKKMGSLLIKLDPVHFSSLIQQPSKTSPLMRNVGTASSASGRISKEEYYLGVAKAVAQRSTCLRRQYGAVIVKDDVIISTGYNGAARGEANCCDIGECWREAHGIPHGEQYEKCVAVHAEANAILAANGKDCIGATLYLAGFENGKLIKAIPCMMCARLIKNARIAEVIGTEAELEECKPEAKLILTDGCTKKVFISGSKQHCMETADNFGWEYTDKNNFVWEMQVVEE